MQAVALFLIIVLVVLLAIDWAQTARIARNPQRWREAWNPLVAWLIARLGVVGVHIYFVAFIAAVLLIAYALRDEPVASAWLAGLAAALQAAPVINNFRKGINP